MKPTHAFRLAAIFAAALVAPLATAQTWPTQRVTFVVPLAPGGAVDIVTRAVAPLVEKKWGQPVVVENRPGAALLVGTNYVAKAAPDGYTLLVSGNGLPATRLFVKNVEFSDSDLRPVVQMVRGFSVAATNADVPAKTLQEFVAYAKTKPKAINFGTIPNTTFDLDNYYFAQLAGIEMTAVPYQGTPAAATALARNELQFFFSVPSTVAPFVAAGRVTLLANGSPVRSEQLPNVPTLRELGFNMDVGYSFGAFAPGKTPDAVVARIAADVAAAVQTPALVARFKEFGFEATGMGAKPWSDELRASVKVYTDLAQKLGIKPQ